MNGNGCRSFTVRGRGPCLCFVIHDAGGVGSTAGEETEGRQVIRFKPSQRGKHKERALDGRCDGIIFRPERVRALM